MDPPKLRNCMLHNIHNLLMPQKICGSCILSNKSQDELAGGLVYSIIISHMHTTQPFIIISTTIDLEHQRVKKKSFLRLVFASVQAHNIRLRQARSQRTDAGNVSDANKLQYVNFAYLLLKSTIIQYLKLHGCAVQCNTYIAHRTICKNCSASEHVQYLLTVSQLEY